MCERVSFTFCVSGAAAVSGVVNFHYKTHQKHAASSVSSACNIICGSRMGHQVASRGGVKLREASLRAQYFSPTLSEAAIEGRSAGRSADHVEVTDEVTGRRLTSAGFAKR